jgi:hypothetical protein
MRADPAVFAHDGSPAPGGLPQAVTGWGEQVDPQQRIDFGLFYGRC